MLAAIRAQSEGVLDLLPAGLTLALLPPAGDYLKLDGKPHGDWLQFVGAFSIRSAGSLAPSGLIVLFAHPRKLAGGFRPALREASGAFSCLGLVERSVPWETLILGYLARLRQRWVITGATVTPAHVGAASCSPSGLMLCFPGKAGRGRLGLQAFYPVAAGIVWMMALLWNRASGPAPLTAMAPII